MNLNNRLSLCAAHCIAALAVGVVGCTRSESLTVTLLENPAQLTSRLPNLTSVDNGIVLSWVHPTSPEKDPVPATYALHTARYSSGNAWSSISTVATGSDWFINWADFPSVYAAPNGSLSAHWLRRSGNSTYAYDIVTSQSTDGISWSEPVTPHLDDTQTEHGFASFFNDGEQPALVWLDGRNTRPSGGNTNHSEHGGAGAMTLRTRTLGNNDENLIALTMSTLLDARVCDCCQTAAANTDSGAVIFYRDRSEDEVRDIYYVRFNKETRGWSSPHRLHHDGWKINGCPVNGPQADATGSLVAVAWFTAAPSPRVQLAVSTDSGASFGVPVVVSQKSPLGRVELVVLSSSRVLVSWLEQNEGAATLKTRLFDNGLNEVSSADVATTTADRRSGFPRMAALDQRRAVIAWTSWTSGKSTVNSALITIR